MLLPMSSDGSLKASYRYIKPTIENCKVTFADGSVYWQRMITNDKFLTIRTEQNKLYLDETCTVLANVTRKEKIIECKKMGLI